MIHQVQGARHAKAMKVASSGKDIVGQQPWSVLDGVSPLTPALIRCHVVSVTPELAPVWATLIHWPLSQLLWHFRIIADPDHWAEWDRTGAVGWRESRTAGDTGSVGSWASLGGQCQWEGGPGDITRMWSGAPSPITMPPPPPAPPPPPPAPGAPGQSPGPPPGFKLVPGLGDALHEMKRKLTGLEETPAASEGIRHYNILMQIL